MVGNPGESWKTIEETLNFMWETKPQQWMVTNFIPLPACPIWKNPAKYGIEILVHDWKEYVFISGQNVGGLTHRTEYMSMEEIAEAWEYLIKNLPSQTGSLEDYYATMEKKS